jgi:predicted nuclease of restriction endonuclease-like (RecB) superfamily
MIMEDKLNPINLHGYKNEGEGANTSDLFAEVSKLIAGSHTRVATVVNKELVLLYWQVGKTVQQNILHNKRADYGQEVVARLAQNLTEKWGKGWSKQQLQHCIRSAETFSKKGIDYAVRRQLSWTHLRTLMYLDDETKRSFYFEMCAHERWSSRQLSERINSMLYERTALSKQPGSLIEKEMETLQKEGPVSENLVFKDPYVLDFLGLHDAYSERDLETAILVELQKFIIELGSDFAFIARQKRITIDSEDYYIDLLFYHRGLRRLVAIDLKLGKFKAAYKGQMELYLRWLEKHEIREGEELPVGLILCADKSEEHVELLMLGEKRIRVAQYLTALPSKNILKERLQQAIHIAQSREQQRMEEGEKEKKSTEGTNH